MFSRIIDISALRNRITKTEFENAVKRLIEVNLPDSDKYAVVEERRLYKPSESKYIWEQNKGLKPHVCEVYYKGEYVCDVQSNIQPDTALEMIKSKVKLIEEDLKKEK